MWGIGVGSAARCRVSLLFLLVLARIAPAAAQELPTGFDRGLFEVRVGRHGIATVQTLIDTTGRPLLPLDPVVALTGLPMERAAGDSIRSLPAVGIQGTATLDLVKRQLRVGSSTLRLSASDAILVGGELYLAVDRMSELLGAEVHVDWGLLAVAVVRSPPFPSERQLEIEFRRAGVRDRQQSATIQRPVVPYDGGTGGTVAEWAVASSTPDPGRSTSANTRFGLAIAGGDLSVGLAHTAAAIPGEGRWQESWTYRRAFPGSAIVHQLHAGDINTGGATLRTVRGLYLSNSPIVRGSSFSEIPIRPDVPRGWEFEIYQNGQLLGFSDGASAVSVPVRYGSTPLTVRMIGPSGEEVVSQVVYQVPPTQLPRHRLEYGIGGGSCTFDECEGFGFGRLDYGVTSWLTIGAGVETSGDTARTDLRPFASLSLASLSGWLGQVHHARDLFSRATLGYYGNAPFYASLAGEITRPGIGQPSFLAVDADRWQVDAMMARRLEGPGRRFHTARIDVRAAGESGDSPDRWRGSVVADTRRGNIGAHYEYDRTSPAGLYLLSGLSVLPDRAPGIFANSAVTGWVGADRDGVQLLELTTSHRLGRHTTFNLTGRRDRRSATSMLSVNLTTALAFGRATARAVSATGGQRSAMGILTGVSTFDPTWGFRSMAYGGIGAAGVGGVVFYDYDGDGLLGPTDSAAANVVVVVGGQRQTSDLEGRYAIWNVVPYEIVDVTIDSIGSIAPDWMPLAPRRLIRATPHRYNRVDVPLVRTRELSGRIVAGPGIWTIGGIGLVIRDVRTNAELGALTFSDGEYYLSRMRPGSYDLAVTASALAALGARAEPASVRFTVPTGGAVAPVEVDSIVLVRDVEPEPLPTTIILSPIDEDRDGVADPADACRSTPPNVPVDDIGCPALFTAERRTLELRGVRFEIGTVKLTRESPATLLSIAEALRARTDIRVEVAGHTDSTGTRALNLRLSAARAAVVRDYLLAQGVPRERVEARGYGPDQPIASNRTAAGRAENRRSELRLLPPDTSLVRFSVELTSVGAAPAAAQLRRRLLDQGFDAHLVGGETAPRLLVGRFYSRRDADELATRLVARGYPARVVRASGR